MKTKTLLIVSLLLLAAGPLMRGQEAVKDTLAFDKASALSPAALLEGRIAGVRVSSYDGSSNGAYSTLIRGVNTLRGDSQPLWIVDGTIINATLNHNNKPFWQYGEKSFLSPLNALSFINPYDIESIEVVKDLSQAARYGSRGANGVIIVKTASGTAEGLNVSVHSNVGVSSSREDISAARSGISHNHYVSITDVNKNTRYSASGYLRRTEGIFAGDDSFYGGLRAAFDTRANKTLWFGMSTILTMGEMNSITSSSYFGQPSYVMSLRYPKIFKADPVSGWRSDYDDESQERRLTTTMFLTINLGKYVKWHNTVGVDFLNNNRYVWYGNSLSFGSNNNGAASVVGTSTFKYNASSELSFARVIARNHNLEASIAAEASGDWTKYNVINGTDFFSHVLRARGVRLAGSQAEPHKYDNNYDTRGARASLGWSFKDLAGVKMLYRADNTPRYDDGKLRDYKAGELFVNIHEALPGEGKVISTLRLSAGYGEAGREQYVPYGLYGDYISSAYPVVDSSMEPFYEGLNRVTGREINLGATLGLMSGRIKVHMAYYDKKSDDAFYGYYFGVLDGKHYVKFGDRQDEFGLSSRIANRGIEADLNVLLVQSGLVRWTLNGNIAKNVNQMLRVDASDVYGRSVGSGTVINANVVGRQVGALYGYRLDTSRQLADLTRDGKIDELDKDIIGRSIPELTGGLGSTLKIGRFVMDILFDGAGGFEILNLGKLIRQDIAPFCVSERNVEDGDYLRLERISLGYDFKVDKVRWIKGLSVNASALNPAIWTAYSGWNPIVNSYGTSALTAGADYGSYPVVRSFVFGVNVNF